MGRFLLYEYYLFFSQCGVQVNRFRKYYARSGPTLERLTILGLDEEKHAEERTLARLIDASKKAVVGNT